MKVRAKLTARAPNDELALSALGRKVEPWTAKGYLPIGHTTLVEKISNGVHWIAAVTVERAS